MDNLVIGMLNDDATLIGILVEAPEPREELIKTIKSIADNDRIPKVDDIALSIQMPCGSEISFKDCNDIPNESLPCACGDPKHWFLAYRRWNGKTDRGNS